MGAYFGAEYFGSSFFGGAAPGATPAPTPEPTPAPVGGYYDTPRKRYIVRKGEQLLVFTNERAAIAALLESDEPQEIAAPKPVVKRQAPAKKAGKEKAAPEPKPAPKPERAVELSHIRQVAKRVPQVDQMLAKLQYRAVIALLERLQDEEDIEMLLLAY